MLQVPNESLMKCDIENVTEADPLVVRMQFAVDAGSVDLDAVHDLEHMVRDTIHREGVRHLYDQDYNVDSKIVDVCDPLKFQARACSSIQCHMSIPAAHIAAFYAIVVICAQTGLAEPCYAVSDLIQIHINLTLVQTTGGPGVPAVTERGQLHALAGGAAARVRSHRRVAKEACGAALAVAAARSGRGSRI